MHAAIEYAEQKLEVHTLHEKTKGLLGELEEVRHKFEHATSRRRELDEAIQDREMDLLIEQRSKFSDLSQAALDRRLKEIQYKDPMLRDLRKRRAVASGEASGLELDMEMLKHRLRVSVARMEELAGYLNFLAAVKNAEPPPVRYAEASTPAATPATGGEAKETTGN